MKNHTITSLPHPSGFSVDPLTDILRQGARDLIQQAVEAELSTLLDMHSNATLPDGSARLVRHGHLPEREVMTGIGALAYSQGHLDGRFSRGIDCAFGAQCGGVVINHHRAPEGRLVG